MVTELVGSGRLISAAPSNKRAGHPLLRGAVAATAVALFVCGMGATASAAPGDQSNDTTIANVGVSSSITLAALTPGFALNGAPGATVTSVAGGDVTMLVTTNNLGGYGVTVQAAANILAATTPANAESIPIAALGVREHNAETPAAFTAVTDASTVSVHSQGTRSAALGDAISNDYQIVIPFVADDTYTVTLNYVATASL